jgi:hypothetical protein
MRFIGWSFISAVAIALTACGGGGTTQFIGSPWPAIAIAQQFLVYPAPGSTGIPDDVKTIVLLRSTSTVTLIPSSGPPMVTTTAVPIPSPLPSPNASAQHPAGAAYSVPPLAAATTYQVWTQDGGFSPNCPPLGPFMLGSFTTQ